MYSIILNFENIIFLILWYCTLVNGLKKKHISILQCIFICMGNKCDNFKLFCSITFIYWQAHSCLLVLLLSEWLRDVGGSPLFFIFSLISKFKRLNIIEMLWLRMSQKKLHCWKIQETWENNIATKYMDISQFAH